MSKKKKRSYANPMYSFTRLAVVKTEGHEWYGVAVLAKRRIGGTNRSYLNSRMSVMSAANLYNQGKISGQTYNQIFNSHLPQNQNVSAQWYLARNIEAKNQKRTAQLIGEEDLHFFEYAVSKDEALHYGDRLRKALPLR